MLEMLLYLLTGAAAGVLAGLLGIGGGVIIVAALVWILPLAGFEGSQVMHVALATALASIVFTSLSSAYAHWKRGGVLWPSVQRLLPGLLLGAWLGAVLATRVPGEVLRWVVAAFCALAAWRMAFAGVRAGSAADTVPRSPWLLAWGGVIGAISALVGIGGGSLTVPLLVWYGARPVRAIGTSACCGFAIAVAGAGGYISGGRELTGLPAGSWGFVYVPAMLGIAAASVLLAPLGVRLAHALSGPSLKRVFSVFLLLVGVAVVIGG